ncbi:hypothetical protein PsYK624_166140 [Phanerochaete sordida]|uniref:F-box domain-containing protein n=1 Tax=Phanerochaete sordida TaxID=48140 RepID=A0A9P3GSK0_9APHY|nr:hypothetical protein PsYK624_166140 [Phanerochaete sordida]
MTCSPPPSSPLSVRAQSPQTPWLFDDIVDEIISFNFDHQPTLHSCTLVSHAWLPLASRYLFRSVRAAARPTSIDEFIAFIKSCERARSSLQELSLRYSHNARHTGPYDVSLSVLRGLVNALPHLRVLKLGEGNRLRVYDDESSATEDSQSSRLVIRKLILADVVGAGDEHLSDVLKLFSVIDELALEPTTRFYQAHARMLLESNLDTDVSTEKVKVGALVFRFWLHDATQSRLLAALGAVLDPAALRRISNVSVTDFAELAQLDTFIHDAATHLEELTLRIFSQGVDTGFQTRLTGTAGNHTVAGLTSLARCTAFSKITIWVDLWPWLDHARMQSTPHLTSNASSFNAACAVLETALKAPTLRSVELVFFLRTHPLSAPEGLITAANVIARVRELPWERLSDIEALGEDFDSILIRLERIRDAHGGRWLHDEMKETLDARFKARVRSLIRYK